MSSRMFSYMKKAYEKHVLVPAFNACYPEMVETICDTLKKLGTFGLLEISRPDIEKFGAISFTAMYREYKKHADPEAVPIHQDHVPVIDEDGVKVDYMSLIKEAIELGYDSVMIDGSRLPLDENIRITREVVSLAHKKDIPVEAELGAVLGHESGPIPPYEELFKSGKGFTAPADAERFVKESGVDWLSVAVGNIHGAITGAAKDDKKVAARLDIDHFKKLQKVTGIPFVLHGGSGIQREYILQAARNGLAKINIGTDIRHAYEKTLKKTGSVQKAQAEVAKTMEYLIVDYFGVKGSRALLDK